ncbi:MAG TPA: hypothetical protein VGG06_02445 [Thermoanaerobaculia bacterium]|jgi:hypothetical protein
MSDEAAFQPWVGQHPDGTADDAPEPYTRVASCRETKVDRLVASTGGRVFYAKEYENLDEVYDEIETELRSQYLLTLLPEVQRRQRELAPRRRPGGQTGAASADAVRLLALKTLWVPRNGRAPVEGNAPDLTSRGAVRGRVWMEGVG